MEALTTAFGTALSGISDDVIGMISTALPVALTILGATLAITIAVRFFKRLAK